MPHVRSRYRAYMRQLRGFKGGFCSAPRPIPPPPGLEPRVQLTLQKLAPTTTDILLDYLAPKARKSISTRVASATVVSGDATKLSVRTRVAAVSIQGRTLASWGSDGLQLSATNDIAGISPHIPAEVSRVSSRRPPEPKNEDSNKDHDYHDCQVASLGSDGLQVVAADSIVGVSSHFPVDSASSSSRRPPEPQNEDSNKDHDCQVASLGSDGLQASAMDDMVGISSHIPVHSASSYSRSPPELNKDKEEEEEDNNNNNPICEAVAPVMHHLVVPGSLRMKRYCFKRYVPAGEQGEKVAAAIKAALAHVDVPWETFSDDARKSEHFNRMSDDMLSGISGSLDFIYAHHAARDEQWNAFTAWLRDPDRLTRIERQNCIGHLAVVHWVRTARTGSDKYERKLRIEAWNDFIFQAFPHTPSL
ncbi:unnamed protein product [Prorocentrum cordatum]|uniref:Uncharacterized protein n=1 Tax=Prorocentrum cordatum TaxID=2364126 RepID=A0ABN9PNW2_9DINO|nr:unnamed protein product [Polarella glacialis]